MQIITNKLRSKVFKRDCYKCSYCRETFEEKLLQVDHILPQSKGGTHEPKNLTTSCKPCNCKKHNKILEYSLEVEDIELEEGDLVEVSTSRTSYPVHPIRISDITWNRLCEQRKKSGLSWNKFIEKMLNI